MLNQIVLGFEGSDKANGVLQLPLFSSPESFPGIGEDGAFVACHMY
jgi:hypothetical protein